MSLFPLFLFLSFSVFSPVVFASRHGWLQRDAKEKSAFIIKRLIFNDKCKPCFDQWMIFFSLCDRQFSEMHKCMNEYFVFMMGLGNAERNVCFKFCFLWLFNLPRMVNLWLHCWVADASILSSPVLWHRHTNTGMLDMRELKKQMNERKAGIQRWKKKDMPRGQRCTKRATEMSEGKCRGKMSMLTSAFTEYICWRELNWSTSVSPHHNLNMML